MPRTRKPALSAKNIQGLKYFKQLQPLFASLHDIGVDPSGNRQLHYDQYASLILLFFFNPTLTSLRGLQQASCLEKVQDKLGCPRTSLGALSAAARAFDAEALQGIVGELAQEALPLQSGKEAEILRGLTAVDGSLLPALPKMAWALWLDEQHRAAKLHLHFDVFKGVPSYATVTDGNGNEKKQLRAALQSGRLYVIDRPSADYRTFLKRKPKDKDPPARLLAFDLGKGRLLWSSTADVFGNAITGPNKWRHRGQKKDSMYQVEHDEMFAAIRAGKPINNGEKAAGTTLLALMGRAAAYTGEIITPEMILSSHENLGPASYEFGPLAMPPIPVPGTTKFA